MAAAYEHVVDEEELMRLRELADTDAEETDPFAEMEADLMALMRKLADMEDQEGDLSPEELAWLEGTEREIAQAGEYIASMADDILRGAAVLETRPGEDPVVAAELRRQAALARARAADAGRVAAAARRLLEKETRRMAAMEHVVDPSVMGFLARVAGEMDYYTSAASSVGGPAPEEMAAAGEEANRVEEEMVTLRLRLVMAAMDCREEALVAALRRQADKAAAALAAVKAFRASVRRYQAATGTSPSPSEDAAESSEDDDVMA